LKELTIGEKPYPQPIIMTAVKFIYYGEQLQKEYPKEALSQIEGKYKVPQSDSILNSGVN
jgi:hypothetical protein